MLTGLCGCVCQQKMIDVLEKSEIKLLRLSKQVTNNEYIITIIKDNRVMQVNNFCKTVNSSVVTIHGLCEAHNSGFKRLFYRGREREPVGARCNLSRLITGYG